MSERWGREQVLALAPDPAAQKAASRTATPATWAGTGCDAHAVWGECRGSGKTAYQVGVDLSEPAFRCSCPSRKFPCKHALALLLLWSCQEVSGAAGPPDWVAEWLTQRQERAARARERAQAATAAAEQAEPAGNFANGVAAGSPRKSGDSKTAARREQRVDDGIAELDQWLRDQVTHGLAQTERAPQTLWEDVARRLVDAQAGSLAAQVKALAPITRSGPSWPGRLLEEYALLRLLTRAHQRRAALPEPLRATVRARIGFTLQQDEVLRSGTRIRDHWYVIGSHDSEQDRLITRRTWLRGQQSGQPALVLTFAPAGRPLDSSLMTGSTVDAELAFYPGAQPLRALVAERHGAPAAALPRGTTVGGLLGEYAAALSCDPWLDRWPAVLDGVRLARADGSGRWPVVDAAGAAVPLRTADPWRLLAVSGGAPCTLAGEWSPAGLLPLSAWHEEEDEVVVL